MRAWTCLLFGTMAVACAATAAPAQSADAPPGQALQEVTVSASRLTDHATLSHAVRSFVDSHATPGTRINQIGRWQQIVCPQVTGLEPPYGDYVAREILDIARGVGALTRSAGRKCNINVEVVFTPQPQALLTHIAQSYRVLLGFYPAAQMSQIRTFTRPVQAWYLTGTRSMGASPPIIGVSQGAPPMDTQYNAGDEVPLLTGVQVDSEATAAGLQPSGIPGSRIKKGLRSEFLHVLIIADSAQVTRYSLRSIADYMAMLTLTHVADLENCAPLPSITDLLARNCATSAPEALTADDRAYLRALYSATLEENLNIERGDVHQRMLQQIEGK